MDMEPYRQRRHGAVRREQGSERASRREPLRRVSPSREAAGDVGLAPCSAAAERATGRPKAAEYGSSSRKVRSDDTSKRGARIPEASLVRT